VPVKVIAPATIKGRLIDSQTGQPSPGRVYVVASDGSYHYGKAFADNKTLSEKQLLQFTPSKRLSYKLPFFYSDGAFEVDVPHGSTKIILERGYGHEVVTEQFDIKPGTNDVTLTSGRFIKMKELGWISGDTHIHWVKNHWSENEDIALLGMVQRAEDLRVANNLTLMHRTANKAFITPSHFPMGPVPGYCDENYHIQMAEEYRNDELYGHLCFLNIFRLILPISTGKGVAGPDAPDYPINKTAILDCRSQGGISTEAHGLGRNWDVPVNVINKLTDALDQISPVDYYRFLDCGFRVPLGNGSDHPARLAGSARIYVKVDGDFTYEKWIDGIRKCRTFTTSGPLLFLEVNNADIGDCLDVKKGDKLKIKAKVLSRYPVSNFQIVSNGQVIKEMKDVDKSSEITFEIEADQPRWFVARCSQSDNYSAISGDNIAHTSAIYVDIDGESVFKPEAAEYWARRMREHSKEIAEKGSFVNDSQREEAVSYIDDGVKQFEQMISNISQQAMSYLDNGVVRIGVDLNIGGVITYLADSKKKINLINSHDWGRQIQMSFYSGPIPYRPEGKELAKNWLHIGWNPIQTGDTFRNRSQLLDYSNDGNKIYIKCRPMHWPLDNEPAQCTFESWLELKGNAVHVRGRINNARADKTQYPARDQELPAVYTNGPWWRLFTYTGSKQFTGDKLTQITKRWATEQDLLEGNVWDNWLATEQWAALVDDNNWGLGVWNPDSTNFQGGFFGVPNEGETKDSPCGYISPGHREIIDYNIQYEYNYVLILGMLDEIRDYVYKNAERNIIPDYQFVSDRQHWHFANASDTGWPIEGCLDVRLSGDTSRIIGPRVYWNAEDAKKLYITAAFETSSSQARVFWKLLGDEAFTTAKSIEFTVIPDGKYRTYTIDMASHCDYSGVAEQIRIDPTTSSEPGQSVKIKKITFRK